MQFGRIDKILLRFNPELLWLPNKQFKQQWIQFRNNVYKNN